MNYLKMLPYQVREAIENNYPIILPIGVVEYHAEHLPLGTDAFTAIDAVERLEKRHPELIILPPFYYGSASFAVASPEGNGTVQVDSAKLIPVFEDIFRSLLRVGFRNIHGVIAHQTEGFAQGMPTDLAFRFAAKHAIFEFLEKEVGEGWWGTEQYSNYYSGGNDPFAWIKMHTLSMRNELAPLYPSDHAGKLETSEIMAIYPECVEMDRLDNSIWFARKGVEATAEYGHAAMEAAADALEIQLFGKK